MAVQAFQLDDLGMRKSIPIRLLRTHPAGTMNLSFSKKSSKARMPSNLFRNFYFTLNDSFSMMSIISTTSILLMWFQLPSTPWDKAQPVKVPQRKFRHYRLSMMAIRVVRRFKTNHPLRMFFFYYISNESFG